MGASRDDFVKYPRTPHLFGLRGSADDKHLGERESTDFIADPSLMPPVWAAKAEGAEKARAVADYIAGMTDRYALIEHAKYFKGTPELR